MKLAMLSEQVDGDTATLEVRGQSPGLLSGELEPTWGTIILVRRAGEWKVSNQAFVRPSKPQASKPQAICDQAATSDATSSRQT